MADSTELKIHIVSDADVAGFNQAATASKTLKVDTSDLSDETKKALGIFEGTNNELKKTPPPEAHEGIGRLNLRGHEMREIFSKLNEIIPGLGIAMRGLGEMSNEAGTAVAAGEGKVAAANEGLIASTGPLIVVVLAIQAAMQYWDLYKEKVKEVAEQQAAACDKIREATHAALEENKKYEEAMAKAVKPEDEYAESLARTKAAIDARTAATEKLLKMDEQAELAHAQTPEQAEAIKKKYGDKERDLTEGAAAQKLAAEGATIERLERDRDAAKNQRETNAGLIGGMAGVLGGLKSSGQGDTPFAADLVNKIEKLNKQNEELDAQILEDQKKITKYVGEARTDNTVQNIEKGGRAAENQENAAQAQEQAGIDIAKNLESGKGATADQINFLQRYAAKLAGHAVSLADAVTIMENAANSPAMFTAQVHRAAKALEGFSGPKLDDLKTAVDRLERQVREIAKMK